MNGFLENLETQTQNSRNLHIRCSAGGFVGNGGSKAALFSRSEADREISRWKQTFPEETFTAEPA